MIEIKYKVGSKSVRSDQIADALMQAVAEQMASKVRKQIEGIRLLETGEFPTVVVHR